MRVLLFFLLAGFALTAASPLHKTDHIADFEELVDDFDYFSEDKPTFEEVKEKLRERFNNFLQKVRDALKGGKDIKDEVLNKSKEIKEKFNRLKEQLNKDGKEFLDKLAEHGRDYLKQIFEKLGVKDKRVVDYHVEAIMQAEEKDDLIQKLKDRFKEVVKKVKDAIDQGKSLKDGLETLDKIRQKLKEFNIDLGDFGNDYLEQLKDKVKDYWKKLKDRLGVSKRSEEINVFGMVQELKELINDEFDMEKVKAFVEKYFGDNKEVIETVTKFMKENGKESVDELREFTRKLVRELVGSSKKAATKDVFEELRDFFEDFGLEIKDRFTNFGKWVKEQYEKGLGKGKDRIENIKTIAKEFSKTITKDTAKEALEFFRKYRKDLGEVFDDLEAKVKKVLKQD